jgi:hypothetical protein
MRAGITKSRNLWTIPDYVQGALLVQHVDPTQLRVIGCSQDGTCTQWCCGRSTHGVILPSLLTVSLFDSLLVGTAFDSQQRVVVIVSPYDYCCSPGPG